MWYGENLKVFRKSNYKFKIFSDMFQLRTVRVNHKHLLPYFK